MGDGRAHGGRAAVDGPAHERRVRGGHVSGGRAAAPDGLVRRGEVARGIEEVMDDDRSAEYRSLKTLSRS